MRSVLRSVRILTSKPSRIWLALHCGRICTGCTCCVFEALFAVHLDQIEKEINISDSDSSTGSSDSDGDAEVALARAVDRARNSREKKGKGSKSVASGKLGKKRERESAVAAVEREQRRKRRKAGDAATSDSGKDGRKLRSKSKAVELSDDSDIDDDGGAYERARQSARSKRGAKGSKAAAGAEVPAWKLKADALRAKEEELRKKTIDLGKTSGGVFSPSSSPSKKRAQGKASSAIARSRARAGGRKEASKAVDLGSVSGDASSSDEDLDISSGDDDEMGAEDLLEGLYSSKAGAAKGGAKGRAGRAAGSKKKAAAARPSSPGGTPLNMTIGREAYVLLKLRQEGGAVEELTVHPREPFASIRAKYAEKISASASKVRMDFDGDELLDSGCPEDAEMEVLGEDLDEYNQVDVVLV